jgi:hypothetical protein
MTARRYHPILPLLLLALLAGCAERPPKPTAEPPPAVRTEELASGRIRLAMTAEPAAVRLDRPLFVTFSLTTPDGVAADWPALDDRFEGFDVAGAYESAVHTGTGRITRDMRVRLMPKPAPEYRLKPMAVTYRDAASSAGWVRTRPVVFKAEALPSASGMAPPADPVVIRPTPREIGLILLIVLGAAALIAGLVLLVRRLLHARKLRQMSPRQRALYELDLLAGRRLVEEGQIKEFYFELTGVVRRYIERSHGIRAPEQTTEEFLASAGADPRFPRESLDRLQAFLTAADYVKFADYRPGPDAGPRALLSARDYVTTDPSAPEEKGRA